MKAVGGLVPCGQVCDNKVVVHGWMEKGLARGLDAISRLMQCPRGQAVGPKWIRAASKEWLFWPRPHGGT